MNINSVQGPAAYASTLNTTVPVDNTQTRDQNLAASQAVLDDQTARVAQQAFEVTITQEAQDRLAQENQTLQAAESETAAPQSEPVPAQPEEEPPARTENSGPNTGSITNIIA